MARNAIILKNPEKVTYLEGIADATIRPGHLVMLASDGKYDPHGTAAGNAAPIFALEEQWASTTGTTKTIDTTYAAADTLQMGVCAPGVEVYALLAANAAAIVAGDYLESAGDGTLRIQTANAATSQAQRRSVVAQATEAVDNSANAAVVRIAVRVV